MFSIDITNTDAFLDMPLSSQALYFHLGMAADDDGFVSNPKMVARTIGANEDDMRILTTKRFILAFTNGIIVIKHWKLNNYIQADRYMPTKWTDEANRLIVKKNGAYTEKTRPMYTENSQSGYTGKVRLGKGRIKRSSNEEVIKLDIANNQEDAMVDEIAEAIEAEKLKTGAKN